MKYFDSLISQDKDILAEFFTERVIEASLNVFTEFSPPCSRALCSSRVNTTKKFEHTSQSVAMYQFEATDVPSSNLSDQITQQHTADGRGISEDTDPF